MRFCVTYFLDMKAENPLRIPYCYAPRDYGRFNNAPATMYHPTSKNVTAAVYVRLVGSLIGGLTALKSLGATGSTS